MSHMCMSGIKEEYAKRIASAIILSAAVETQVETRLFFQRFALLPFSSKFGMICTQFFAKGRSMKDGIHPQYGDATITCACGNVIHTRSTKPEMQVNTCSACHPYFTGQKTMVDTEGRVDMFKKRYAKFAK